MTTTANLAFNEPTRPQNLQLRFVTVGGSFVDVIGCGEHSEENRWTCHGCKDTSRFPEKSWLFEMREKANAHAEACRAISLA